MLLFSFLWVSGVKDEDVSSASETNEEVSMTGELTSLEFSFFTKYCDVICNIVVTIELILDEEMVAGIGDNGQQFEENIIQSHFSPNSQSKFLQIKSLGQMTYDQKLILADV